MDLYNLRVNKMINDFGIMMLKNPNITGVGRGSNIINGFITNIPTITFFVLRKLSSNLINKNDIIPSNIRGVLTDVVESESCYDDFKISRKNFCNDISNVVNFQEDRPAMGGGCLSYITSPTSRYIATLTYAVTDKGTRENIYFLASGHFFKRNYGVNKDKTIYYSKTKDGVIKAFRLGEIYKIFENKYDAVNALNKITKIQALVILFNYYKSVRSKKAKSILYFNMHRLK